MFASYLYNYLLVSIALVRCSLCVCETPYPTPPICCCIWMKRFMRTSAALHVPQPTFLIRLFLFHFILCSKWINRSESTWLVPLLFLHSILRVTLEWVLVLPKCKHHRSSQGKMSGNYKVIYCRIDRLIPQTHLHLALLISLFSKTWSYFLPVCMQKA